MFGSGSALRWRPMMAKASSQLHRQVAVGSRVIAHRMGQPPDHFELVVAPACKLGDGVRGKEFRRAALGRRFPGDRLAAVLAELERRGVFRVGPGAARAVEARAAGSCAAASPRPLTGMPCSSRCLAERLERAPSAGRLMVGLNGFPAHGELSLDVTIHGPVKDRGAGTVFSNRISICSIAQVRVSPRSRSRAR